MNKTICGYLVVARDVLVQSSEHDHGHHDGEEDHDDEGVDDAEPLDVGVGHGVQDVIPARRPTDVVVFLKIKNKINKKIKKMQ